MSIKAYDNSMVDIFPDKFKMELPDDYRIDIDYDEDGEQSATLRGGFSFNDEGEETAEFSAAFITMNSTIENRENLIKEGKLKENFVPGLMLEQVAEGVMEQLQEQFGPGTRLNLYDSYPASVVMKFYKPISIFGITIESYIVMYLVEVTENLFFGFNTVYQNNEDGNDTFYKHLLNVMKAVRVSGKAVDTGKLTPKKLEAALNMEPDDDVEAINLGASIGINIQNGDEETRYTLNSDGSITEETVSLSDEDDIDDFDEDEPEDEQENGGILDTIRISDSYEQSFLREHGKDIKRMIATGYGYVNYIALASCPNVEEFIADNNSAFSFVDGVLYSQRGNNRTIEYITKDVKHLHIDADVTDVSSYWHGVEEVTVDPKNSTFTVQGNMLLSRRKNTLYFVTSKAEEVVIPEGVTQIHCRAFQYCENIKKVVFPASYEWKGWNAANSDPILITPENMKDAEIIINGDKASYENGMVVTPGWNRTEAKLYLGDRKLCRIPANMTSTFGFDQAFALVENFEVSEDNPAFSSANGVILDKSGQKLLFYPRTRKEFVIPSSVNEIVSHSAANCNELTEIVIPANINTIGQMAFANCICLSKVTTLNPKADIHEQAFFGCHLLNGDGFAEPVDEEELKKSVAKEIRKIRRSNKRNKDSGSSYGDGLFGLGSLFSGSDEKEVRISDEDDRKVIVDNKWSFRLPDGLEMRFNSEHVDIMGSTTTANYVVEGLEDNGRFFFDFELRERFEDGMSTDVDVIGCRHDNDVTSGNAQQKIIKDSDDLFVDIVSKSVFFFNSMISIRVRGDDIRSWDFTAGLKSSDEEMSAKWDDVKKLINELAGSIELLDAAGKPKNKKKKDEVSDPDFVVSNGVLRKYTGKKNKIVIPDGVTEIADSAFSGFSKLKSVVIPEGVKRIGRRCFENCVNLRDCYLPESLEEICGYAFVDCHTLKEVYLNDKIKSLGDSTFSECFALKDVRLPKKIKAIDAFAFKNCDAFTHIVIPEGVKSIGASAFASCDNLEYLYIPKSVTEFQTDFMNNHPFTGSDKLTIYTPAGSDAQKFAEDNGIPYKNEAKGKITADNTNAKSGAAAAPSVSTETKASVDGLAYATPDESLYPHYDSKQGNQGLNLFGISIIRNSSGTDYQFYHLTEDLDDDASEELKSAVSKLSDTGASQYNLAGRAAEMRSVFHVSPDIYNFRDDRECELYNDYMKSAYMMSGLRSFAWTLSKYCDDNKIKPENLSLEQIQSIVDFIADREWLNYDGDSYCKALCGTSDVHVYYIPDNTPKNVRKFFETSEQELEDARKMKEQFPSYNPIFSQTGSLDGLREDLEYIYPAIEKIYEDLKAGRNISEPLTGNDADILYAWCALAYAARSPFFTEDGPTMYMHSQIETEEEKQAKREEQRKQAIQERAEYGRKYMASYGKYFEKNPRIIFKDKKFVFSGLKERVYTMEDDTDYKGLIESRGGLTRKGVSGVTDYLVVDPAGAGESKINTAIENQKNGKPIKIILLDDLRKALGLQDDDAAEVAPVPAQKPKATAPAKASTPAKKTAAKAEPAVSSDEKEAIVDNTWVVTIPAGFKYSTDKNEIGDHRNIIIMEDKPDNMYEWPFDASISFTSAFNDSQDQPPTMMAKIMTGFMGSGNEVVLRDEDDIYVVYWYDKNRSEKDLQIFQIQVGCGRGVSGIQVFFNGGNMSRREQTKLVEKVAKSIKLVGEATSFSTSPGLTAEERGAIQDAQKALDDIGKALDDIRDHWKATESERLGLMAYFDKMEEREKKEKAERKKNKKKAAAAGKSDADIVNMYVVLCNEEKAKTKGMTSSKFYKLYEDFFPAFTKDELWNARKDMLAKMQDNDLCKEYAESFRKRSIQDRFNIATKSYFTMEMDSFRDSTLCAEDAIDNTTDWFVADEMPAVKQLMNNELIKQNNRITEQFSWAEPEWMKYSKAKDYLEIQISDYNERKELVSDECKMFQVKLDKFGGPFLVAAVLRQKSYMPLVVNVMDACTHYWGVSQSEIWEAAFRNNVRNSSDASFDERQYAKEAMWIAKTNYPDLKEIKRIRKEESEKKVGKFVRDIKRLCENEVSIKASEVNRLLKEDFSSASELAEYKAKLAEAALKEKLEFLPSILSAHEDAQELYDSLPEILTERMNTAIEEKILAANEAKYNNAINLSESDDMKDINAARDIFASLGLFKDAKALEQQCVTKIDNIKTAQYDEALALRANGSEESIHKAINILTELGSFKAANEKVKEYKNELDRRRKLEEIKTLSQSESIADLNKAITMLEEFREESANAEALINHCNNKLEKIKEERYSQAISLAEEGTEASIKSAILKMDAIKPFKDAAEKAEAFREQLHNEGVYNNAVALMDSTDISDLVVAQGIFENLGNYKDAVSKAISCEKRIDELREKMYQEGLSAQKIYSLKSQKEAISKFNQLGSYKDSFERKNQCNENCKNIQAILDLNKEIEGHKKELAAITGAFKKKERQSKEALISAKEQRVNELKDKLTGKRLEPDKGQETDIDVIATDVNTSNGLTDFTSSVTDGTSQDSYAAPKKKSKTGIVIIIAILAIIVIIAVFALGGNGANNTSSTQTQSSTATESSTQASTNNYATLEEFLYSDPAAVQDIEQSAEESGLEVSIVGNSVIYTYDLLNEGELTKEQAQSQEMIDALESGLDDLDEQFTDICIQLETESGIKGVIVKVIYTYDGETLIEREYKL